MFILKLILVLCIWGWKALLPQYTRAVVSLIEGPAGGAGGQGPGSKDQESRFCFFVLHLY